MCQNVFRLQAAFHRWINSLQSIHAGAIRDISMGGRWAQGSPTRVQRTEEQMGRSGTSGRLAVKQAAGLSVVG